MLSLAFSWNRARTDTDTPCVRCTTRVSTQHEYARAARAQVAFGSNPGQKNVAQLRPPRAPMRKGMSVHTQFFEEPRSKKMKHEKRKRHCQRMTRRFFVELICSPLFFSSCCSCFFSFFFTSHFFCCFSFLLLAFFYFFFFSLLFPLIIFVFFSCFFFFFPFFFPPPSLFFGSSFFPLPHSLSFFPFFVFPL